MVDGLDFLLVAFWLTGFLAGGWFTFVLMAYVDHKVERDHDKPAKASIAKKFGWFKPDPKPVPGARPVGTLPRSQGSWRTQRIELQKAHNTKQKERDALMEKANAKTR